MTDKKELIINKAIDLFATKGFEGTSIRDIASAAEVNVAMINYYFGTKEKLFEALVKAKAANTRGVLDELDQNKSLPAIDKLDRVIETYVESIFTGRKFHRVLHQEMMLGNREALNQIIVNVLFPNSNAIRGIIEAAIKKGEFRKVDPELTVASLIGTINQVVASKKFCNMFMGKQEDYVPYEDPKFKKRMVDHLKSIMHAHLLKQSN